MRVILRYGKQGLPLTIAEGWDATIIRKPPMPVLADPSAAAALALTQPVGSAALQDEAAGRRSACIAICDVTRPVPNDIFLPAVLQTLLHAGMRVEDVTILVATGLHRPCTEAELRQMLGDPSLLDIFRIANHRAYEDSEHVLIGTTSRGTPARLDRRFLDAELRIVTGLVEPHVMAGYSGGRKVIAPGICHAETICALHSAQITGDPNATNCILEGNPLHEEQLEILEMVGPTLAVNTVIDEERRPSFVSFGEVQASHCAAVECARRWSEVPVNDTFRTVVTTSAGFPLDCNYYQTAKGIAVGAAIVADGGTLLVASECSEGLGSAEFVASQRRLAAMGREAFLADMMARPRAAIDEWGSQVILKHLDRARVGLYSDGLSDDAMALTGAFRVTSLESAIQDNIDRSGDNRIAVVPEGPYCVPVVRETACSAGD